MTILTGLTLHPAQSKVKETLNVFRGQVNDHVTQAHARLAMAAIGFPRVVCDSNNNTPDLVDAKKLSVILMDGLYSTEFVVSSGGVTASRYKRDRPRTHPDLGARSKNPLGDYRVLCDETNSLPVDGSGHRVEIHLPIP